MLLARSHKLLRNVPIILCTADVWTVKQRATDLEQIASVHVLTKPFAVDDMTQLIEELLAADHEAGRLSQAQFASGPPPA